VYDEFILVLNLCSQRRTHSALDYGTDRLIDPTVEEVTGE
jgi:hypothetical protein